MHHAEIRGRIRGRSPDDVFAAISDFGSYAELGPDIRSISVEQRGENEIVSTWDVDFRGGSMQWSEADTLIPDRRRIEFEQTEGSLRHFVGHWQVDEDPDGAIVTVAADFAIGMPSMAAFVEPIAETTIVENIQAVLTGMFGEAFEPV